jgi:hypothetical protein
MSQVDAGSVVLNMRVNLATLKEGMAEGTAVASRSARQMAGEMKEQMNEAKGSMMLLGEEIGVHIPRHVQTFIAQLPGVSKALSAAFSSIAVLAIIEVIIKIVEHIQAVKDKADKLAEAWRAVGYDGEKALAQMDEQILEAQKKVDELTGNHLAALRKEIQLIDNQTLDNLAAQFDELSKKTLAVFKDMERGWLEVVSMNSNAGIKDVAKQLHEFMDTYDQLLAKRQGPEAADLLKKTLDNATAGLERLQGNVFANPETVEAQQRFINLLQTEVALQEKSVEVAKAKKTAANLTSVQGGENASDQGLKDAKDLADKRAKIQEDSFKLQEAQAKDGYAALRGLSEQQVVAEEQAAIRAADAKYFADLKYWRDVKALHASATEEDKKTREKADREQQKAQLDHNDALFIILTDSANKRVEIQKQAIQRGAQAEQDAVRRDERIAQDKFKLQGQVFAGEEEHIKALAQLHQISSDQELKMLRALHDKMYEAELKLLDSKVQNAARELVIEATKNGQILTMDEALKKAKEGLDSEYELAKQKKLNDDQKATDEQLLKLKKSFDQFGRQFQDTLNQQLLNGKAQWGDFFNYIRSEMLKLIEQRLFDKLFGSLLTGSGGGGGGFGGFLSGIFSSIGGIFSGGATTGAGAASTGGGGGDFLTGFAAEGASVMPGEAWVVGEKHPELFVPDRAGTILPQIPTVQTVSRPQQIHAHFHDVKDIDTFRASEGQMLARLQNAVNVAAMRNR